MKKCVVVIPIYKTLIDSSEIASLMQCKVVLNKYDIKFVCPASLNTKNYSDMVDFEFIKMQDEYFQSDRTYSKMLLNDEFYKIFEEYEYMLIYHLDAWVFEDKVEEWCNKDYDYIGAPWFERYDTTNINSKMLKFAGNGGFSLRKIRTFIDVLSHAHNSNKKMKTFLEIYTKEFTSSIFNILRIPKSLFKYFSKENTFKLGLKSLENCEDNIIVNSLRPVYPQIKVAEAEEAKHFAFEVHPSRLFKECENKLPFGCHAFKKYDWNFWEKYIRLDN